MKINIAGQIEELLIKAFTPSFIHVADVSHHHAGHASAPAGGQSHFELTITADAFQSMSRIQAHRLIHAELADLLAGPIHALQITIKKPEKA